MLDSTERKVHTANLGDSSYYWLWKSGMDVELFYKAPEQTMGFNFPKQVGTNGNHPSEADLQTHDVQVNDIFLLGTDGLFDNLYERDILDIIWPFIKHEDTLLDPELVA